MKLFNRIGATQLFLIIACMYGAGFFAHALYLGKTVYGDGTYYYAWLSLQPSKFSVGPALFWAPVYMLTRNQIAVGAATVLAAIFALVLLWRLLGKTFSQTVSLMTVAAIAGASNLLFYGSLDVVNSHALTFFAATVFLTLILAKQKHWFAMGAALGILGLMRTQDLLYGILLIPSFWQLRRFGRRRPQSKTDAGQAGMTNIFRCALGCTLAFLPQLIAWHLTTGSYFVSPYLTGNEGFNLLHPHILGVLFNVRSGLFLWTPITIVGVAGLLHARRYLMLLVFILELYLVASWSTWWQGASYSGRMFVSSLPILAFGIASIFSWLARLRWTQAYFLLVIVAPLSVMNGLSIIYFLLSLPGR